MPSITRSQSTKKKTIETRQKSIDIVSRKRLRKDHGASLFRSSISISIQHIKSVLQIMSIAKHVASFLDIQGQINGRIATMQLMPYVVPCHYWMHDKIICAERSRRKHQQLFDAEHKQHKQSQVIPLISELIVNKNARRVYDMNLIHIILDMEDPISYLEWYYKNYSLDIFLSWFVPSMIERCHIKALQWCEDQIKSSSSGSSSASISTWSKFWETSINWSDCHPQPTDAIIQWLCVDRPTLGCKHLHCLLCLHNGGALARSLLQQWSFNHVAFSHGVDRRLSLWKAATTGGNPWCIEYTAKEWFSFYIQDHWKNDNSSMAVYNITTILNPCLSFAGRWQLIWPRTVGVLSYKPDVWKHLMDNVITMNDGEEQAPQMFEFYRDVILLNLPHSTSETFQELQDILSASISKSRQHYQWDLCRLLLNHLYPNDDRLIPCLNLDQLEWKMLSCNLYPLSEYDGTIASSWFMFYKQLPIYETRNHVNMCSILEHLQDNKMMEKLPQDVIVALYTNALFFKRPELLPKVLSPQHLKSILALWKCHPREPASKWIVVYNCIAQIQHVLLVMLHGPQEQLRIYCQDNLLQILNLFAASDCTEVLDLVFQHNQDHTHALQDKYNNYYTENHIQKLSILKLRFVQQLQHRKKEHEMSGNRLILHWLSQQQ
jgi:hypothetical protein